MEKNISPEGLLYKDPVSSFEVITTEHNNPVTQNGFTDTYLYILEAQNGHCTITRGDKVLLVNKGDFLTINPGEKYTLLGSMKIFKTTITIPHEGKNNY